jgi:hypothetical protein
MNTRKSRNHEKFPRGNELSKSFSNRHLNKSYEEPIAHILDAGYWFRTNVWAVLRGASMDERAWYPRKARIREDIAESYFLAGKIRRPREE